LEVLEFLELEPDAVFARMTVALLFLDLQFEELQLLSYLLLAEFLLSQFSHVVISLHYALLEFFVEILTHLVELVPFLENLLQFPICLNLPFSLSLALFHSKASSPIFAMFIFVEFKAWRMICIVFFGFLLVAI
jgi:hypothetical protein